MISLEQEYLKRVCSLMKHRRVSLSMKQREAADRAGVHVRTLQHFEQTGHIRFSNLIRLWILYGMDKRVVGTLEDRSWWTIQELERAERKTKVR